MRNLFLVVMCLALASCGSLKRSTSNERLEVATVESTSTAETIVTTAVVDTIVTLPPDTMTSARPLQELIDNSTLVFESDAQKVELMYDPVSKTVRTRATVKGREIPIKKEVVTVATREIDSKAKVQVKQEQKQVEVNKTRSLIPWWVWLVLIFVAMVVLGQRVGMWDIFGLFRRGKPPL
jgi:hypothetical protein